MLVRLFGFMAAITLFACAQNQVNIDATLFTVRDTDSALTRLIDTVLYHGEPFNGRLQTFHANDQLASEKYYQQGVLHGMSIKLSSQGDTLEKRLYNHAEKHGNHRGWFANGQLKFHYYFEQGYAEGKQLEWYASGQPFKIQHFEKGRERGSQKVFREDGKLRANYVVRENGRKYGLMGVKRCKNIDLDSNRLAELKPDSTYSK